MVTLWLASETAQMQDSDAYMAKITAASYGFANLWCVVSNGHMIFSNGEVEALACASRHALQRYQWLACKSSEQSKLLFCLQPTFHKLDELLRRAERTKLNPAWTWICSEESWIGLFVYQSGRIHS